jgi:hypothetical protein
VSSLLDARSAPVRPLTCPACLMLPRSAAMIPFHPESTSMEMCKRLAHAVDDWNALEAIESIKDRCGLFPAESWLTRCLQHSPFDLQSQVEQRRYLEVTQLATNARPRCCTRLANKCNAT